jgi:hypothetical protein
MQIAECGMWKVLPCKAMVLLLMLSFFLMGADNGTESGGERDALLARQKTLCVRIDALRSEQDYLLFQKAMYAADSKYLVLHLTEKRGQLWYKNRLLNDFYFTLSENVPDCALKQGMLVLTKKDERKGDRDELVFGKTLVIKQGRAAVPPRDAGIAFLFLPKKVMASIFFAVEEGALAYVVQ